LNIDQLVNQIWL